MVVSFLSASHARRRLCNVCFEMASASRTRFIGIHNLLELVFGCANGEFSSEAGRRDKMPGTAFMPASLLQRFVPDSCLIFSFAPRISCLFSFTLASAD
jgi:hypothetical protein